MCYEMRVHQMINWLLLFDLDVSSNQSQSAYFLELTDLSDTFSLLFNAYIPMLLTLLLGDKQARRD